MVPLLAIILSFKCWQCITTTCTLGNPRSTLSELLHIITKVTEILCSHGRVNIIVFRYVTSSSLYPENQVAGSYTILVSICLTPDTTP